MRLRTTATALALICSASANAQDMKAEVIHWWTSSSESAAVKVFADRCTRAGGLWIDNAIAGGVNARAVAINRTLGGNPPTAMQFNTGKQFDELIELLARIELHGRRRIATDRPIDRDGARAHASRDRIVNP